MAHAADLCALPDIELRLRRAHQLVADNSPEFDDERPGELPPASSYSARASPIHDIPAAKTRKLPTDDTELILSGENTMRRIRKTRRNA